MRLSKSLIDYVILHELVHTQIKNHSSVFWDMLNKYVGNPKLKNKLLKKFVLV